jgi:hypothetical protein
MLLQAEVDNAVDDIINECIIVTDKEKPVEINLDDVDLPDRIKKLITEEFENVTAMLDFSNKAYDIFQRFYVDGRIRYHVIIDNETPKEGIKELRYIDPRKIRKVREIQELPDPATGVIRKVTKSEYYIYNDSGFAPTAAIQGKATAAQGVAIAKDSVVEATSGILNEHNTLVLSHLHKAIKPLNQLRMLEDASVIYRISRAPERRVFYIDVGNLPKVKAEQYLRDTMVKHKNRLVYDASTGEIRDDRKFMTMLEDFWLPRREGGRGTEVETLQGGQNLGEMDDIVYFQKKLYKSLNVPVSRLEPEMGFQIGRASEISRDEIKFSRFIFRLRNRFTQFFDGIMEKQLLLKGIVTAEEWSIIKNNIRYDFRKDNHFEEMKEMEILRERLSTLRDIDSINGAIGGYFSKLWIRKNVLMQTDEDIKDMDKEIKAEPKEEQDEDQNRGFPK